MPWGAFCSQANVPTRIQGTCRGLTSGTKWLEPYLTFAHAQTRSVLTARFDRNGADAFTNVLHSQPELAESRVLRCGCQTTGPYAQGPSRVAAIRRRNFKSPRCEVQKGVKMPRPSAILSIVRSALRISLRGCGFDNIQRPAVGSFTHSHPVALKAARHISRSTSSIEDES